MITNLSEQEQELLADLICLNELLAKTIRNLGNAEDWRTVSRSIWDDHGWSDRISKKLISMNVIPNYGSFIWKDGYEKGKDEMREQINHLMKYTVMD